MIKETDYGLSHHILALAISPPVNLAAAAATLAGLLAYSPKPKVYLLGISFGVLVPKVVGFKFGTPDLLHVLQACIPSPNEAI